MPVGPYILCPLKAKKSQSRSCTSIFMWGALCAPSTKTGMPWAWASRMMSLTGLMVPSTLLTWAMLTSRVRSVKYVAMPAWHPVPFVAVLWQHTKRPSSVMGMCFTTMPRFMACNCQLTMLE